MNQAQPSDYGHTAERNIVDIFADWVFRNLAGDKDEYCSPPGSEVWVEFGEIDPGHGRPFYTATTYNDDGFELWIAYTKGSWLAHFRANDARRLALIILWDWWARSTWFGLKRAIWYRALGWICKRREASNAARSPDAHRARHTAHAGRSGSVSGSQPHRGTDS